MHIRHRAVYNIITVIVDGATMDSSGRYKKWVIIRNGRFY